MMNRAGQAEMKLKGHYLHIFLLKDKMQLQYQVLIKIYPHMISNIALYFLYKAF